MSAGPTGIMVLEYMELTSDARVPYKQIMVNIERVATEKGYLKIVIEYKVIFKDL